MSIRRMGQMLLEEYKGLTRQLGQEDGEYEFRRFVSGLRKTDANPKAIIDERTFSLKALMESCMASPRDPFGEQWARTFPLGMHRHHRGMFEAIDAIGASAFAQIGGQLMVDKVRDNYELAVGEINELMELRPNPAQNLGTHLDPWLSRVYEEPQIVEAGQPFPWSHFTEQYIQLPPPELRELGLAIEMEMIYADKTRQAMQRAAGLGERMGLNKAKRCLATITGLSFTYGPYTYTAQSFVYNGTSYTVFRTSGLWINQKSGLVVTNYSNVTEIEKLFGHMTDLATGDPIDVAINDRAVLCVWDKQWDLHAAFTATDHLRGSFPTSGDNIQTHYPSPIASGDRTRAIYRIIPSKLLYNMLTTMLPGGSNLTSSQAFDYLWWGNFRGAFGYREVMPPTVVQAPPGNPAEFYQRIAIQAKITEWGVPFTQGPQQVVNTYNN